VKVKAGVRVKRGMAVMVGDDVCVEGGNSGEDVGEGDSSPVTGIPGSSVRVTTRVCAMAVFIMLRSGVGCPGAQACGAINNTEPNKNFRIVLSTFPPFW
jgi:hypothetical protein